MMDLSELEAASQNVNNLLLARGLLPNAEPLHFATPERAPGGAPETLARILNLVHDLIRRRDKVAKRSEAVAEVLRDSRIVQIRQGAEIDRLERKNADLARALAASEAQERASQSTVQAAESAAKSLREQSQRLQASIQQVRAHAAAELRKKDVQLAKLKAHVSERQRGRSDGPTVIAIKCAPPVKTVARTDSGVKASPSDSLATLRSETNEYLSRLCQRTSDENTALLATVRRSIDALHELQRIATSQAEDHGTSTNNSTADSPESVLASSSQQCQDLAQRAASAVASLRATLTTSRLIPQTELDARSEEIQRLREGWEQMELKWSEALRMMDKGVAAGVALAPRASSYADRASERPPQSTPKRRFQELAGKTLRSRATEVDSTDENVKPRRGDASESSSEVRHSAPSKAHRSKPRLSVIIEEPRRNSPAKLSPRRQAINNRRLASHAATRTSSRTPSKDSKRLEAAGAVNPATAASPSKHLPRTPSARGSDTKGMNTGRLVSVSVPQPHTVASPTPQAATPSSKSKAPNADISREATVVLQRNAEHVNITKRRKSTRRSTAVGAVTSTMKAVPRSPVKMDRLKQVSSSFDKQSPVKKRKSSPAKVTPVVKRRRSMRHSALSD